MFTAIGMLQKGHPGIAIAVKTRHASRTVLNQMRETLLELKEDGKWNKKEAKRGKNVFLLSS